MTKHGTRPLLPPSGGPRLEDAFAGVALAMLNYMTPLSGVQATQTWCVCSSPKQCEAMLDLPWTTGQCGHVGYRGSDVISSWLCLVASAAKSVRRGMTWSRSCSPSWMSSCSRWGVCSQQRGKGRARCHCAPLAGGLRETQAKGSAREATLARPLGICSFTQMA